MTTGELVEQYAELHGHASRTRHRKYLIRKIAWRIQANAEGEYKGRTIDLPETQDVEALDDLLLTGIPEQRRHGYVVLVRTLVKCDSTQ